MEVVVLLPGERWSRGFPGVQKSWRRRSGQVDAEVVVLWKRGGGLMVSG